VGFPHERYYLLADLERRWKAEMQQNQRQRATEGSINPPLPRRDLGSGPSTGPGENQGQKKGKGI
jgi:hypothetical protein